MSQKIEKKLGRDFYYILREAFRGPRDERRFAWTANFCPSLPPDHEYSILGFTPNKPGLFDVRDEMTDEIKQVNLEFMPCFREILSSSEPNQRTLVDTTAPDEEYIKYLKRL